MPHKLYTPLNAMTGAAGILLVKSLERLPLSRKNILVISTAVITPA
ncbi:MAG: hypothetical protein AABZ13_06730 [Planctomycetota bacterium]